MTIKKAITKADIEFCSKAMLEFRQNLDPETFADQTARMMQAGFRLIYIPDEDYTGAAAVAGFRIFEMLRTGPIIYIDDLFTLPGSRGKGYAGKLLDHIDTIAKESNIKTVHLDSGFALHPAHKLYLSRGYILACHHFAKSI